MAGLELSDRLNRLRLEAERNRKSSTRSGVAARSDLGVGRASRRPAALTTRRDQGLTPLATSVPTDSILCRSARNVAQSMKSLW